MEGQDEGRTHDLGGDRLTLHVVQAVEGVISPEDHYIFIYQTRVLPFDIFEEQGRFARHTQTSHSLVQVWRT